MSFEPTKPHKLAHLPPSINFETSNILKALIGSSKALGELRGYSPAMPNPMLLLSPAILQESVASSKIEAINTTVESAFQAQLFPEIKQKPSDIEVNRYSHAINWGYSNLKSVALSTRFILGIHKKLLAAQGGHYRKQQNKIVNNVTGEIIYTPPIASEIPELIGNWENFVNSLSDDLNPLLKCALAHYQFEAIHPFLDGNGRTGRIMMIFQLVNSTVLDWPILYISGYLDKNKAEYYNRLLSVTRDGAWEEYLLFMLKAFETQATKTQMTLFQIMSLYEEIKESVKKKHKNIYSSDLVGHLFSQPVTTPTELARNLSIHYTTASRYLTALKKTGILIDAQLGRNHLFYNDKLLKLLHD